MVGGMRILIVEDEVAVARALQRALSLPQGGGYRAESCGSGEAALERLRAAQFDLMITDFYLPGINGLELLRLARQISPDMHSVLITAFGSPQVKGQAHCLADAYLSKPFHLQDIIQTVRCLLNQPVVEAVSRPGVDVNTDFCSTRKL
jgi:CheY-like chemotaxis protein